MADRDAYANLLLPALLTERGMTGRDAAFATELTYGTLRGQGTYDAILAACSDRDQMDPPVRDILRLGAHQLLATRIGSHAAVATSVDLAKDVCGPRPSGFVNAVLRRVATRDLESWIAIVTPPRSTDETGYLSVSHSYPRWIVESFAQALSTPDQHGTAPDQHGTAPETEVRASASEQPPATAESRARTDDSELEQPPATAESRARTDDAELEQALAAGNARPVVVLAVLSDEPTTDGTERTQWSPFGLRLSAGGDPAPLIATGLAAAQDEASQLAAIALSRVPVTGPDRLWLDMCAGPGGKARLLQHLATGRGARLVAGEYRPHRAKRVLDALRSLQSARTTQSELDAQGDVSSVRSLSSERDVSSGPSEDDVSSGPSERDVSSGHTPAVVVADGRRAAWRPGTFDRAIADVPCSGLGSLRRRSEARWRKTPDDIPELAALQRQLLQSAIDSVRPGGVVAYVTCSPHIAETYDVVTAVTAARDDVTVLDAPAVLAEVPGLSTPRDMRFAQFWPHRHGTDAIFLALLRRE